MKKSIVICVAIVIVGIASFGAIHMNAVRQENKMLLNILKYNLQQECMSSYDESEFGISADIPLDTTTCYLYDYATDEQVFQTQNEGIAKHAIKDLVASGIEYTLEKQDVMDDNNIIPVGVKYVLKYNTTPFVPIAYYHLEPMKEQTANQ